MKEEPQKNLLPQNIIRNFVANFTTFTNSALQNDYKNDEVSLNNLGKYAEQEIDKKTSISRLVLGVVLNDQQELDFSKVFNTMFIYVTKALIMSAFIIIIGLLIKNLYIKLILQLLIACVVYVIFNYKYIIYDFFGRK